MSRLPFISTRRAFRMVGMKSWADASAGRGAISRRDVALSEVLRKLRELATHPDRRTKRSGDAALLSPILVDCTGRDGSTLMMRLLATSPEIAAPGPYPYEKKYFASLWRWSRLLERPDDSDLWAERDLALGLQHERIRRWMDVAAIEQIGRASWR